MENDEPLPDFGLYDEQPRWGRRLVVGLFGLGFTAFLVGGAFFGHLFLENWKVLASRRGPGPVQVQLPGGQMLTIPDPPAVLPQLPSLPGLPQAEPNPGGSARPAPAIPLPDWTDRERLNVLLLGIDHRDDEPIDGSRSDTLMLVSIDPVSKTVVMVSLPRDLWVSIPGYGEQRINVAHSLGGPDLAMRTVAANFNLKINHYARIDFRGFEQIVTTLGGIQIDVERPIKDDEYPTDDYGVMRIYIPPGPQWMDGRTALQYARSRHSEDDFGRARRQQRVLLAIRDRAVQANMIFKAPELVPLAQKTVSTDFGPLDLIKLAKLSTEIGRERVMNVVIDTTYATPWVTPDGAEVLIPNRAAIQSAISQAFARSVAAAPTPTPAPPTPTATRVPAGQPAPAMPPRLEVLNGTNRDGLARTTGDWLRGKGYEIASVNSADRSDYPETRLFAQPGREAAARTLAATLGLPAAPIQPLAASPSGPDIRIILGQNFQLPQR